MLFKPNARERLKHIMYQKIRKFLPLLCPYLPSTNPLLFSYFTTNDLATILYLPSLFLPAVLPAI